LLASPPAPATTTSVSSSNLATSAR